MSSLCPGTYAFYYTSQHYWFSQGPQIVTEPDRKRSGLPDEDVDAQTKQGEMYRKGAPTRKLVHAAGMVEGQNTGK